MERINIEFTLFSAFYSPLISMMSGGFLKAEGLEGEWTVSPPGASAVRHWRKAGRTSSSLLQAKPSHP